MSEKRWRCMGCRGNDFPFGRDFIAHVPQCPHCGTTVDSFDGAILPLVSVHFLAPDRKGPILSGITGRRFRVACNPGMTKLTQEIAKEHSWTGEPKQVSCPNCLDTKECKDALAAEEAMAGGQLLHHKKVSATVPDIVPKN